MPHISGKAFIVPALFLVSCAIFLLSAIRDSPQSLPDPSILAGTGVSSLDVEYTDGKIYLNVQMIAPGTCDELVSSLKIQPITIKSRTYLPTCSKISDTLMRVTYTRSISV